MAFDLATYSRTGYDSECIDNEESYEKSTLRSRYFGENRCNRTLKSKLRHVNENALCPWYYDVTYDANRNPSVMLDAKCRCPRQKKTYEKSLYNCERLTIAFPVLRRHKKTSIKWKAVKENIGIACVCKKPISN